MNFQPVFKILALVFLVLGLLAGFQAWRAYQAAEIIVEWSTASELDVAGFNLYRSASPEGPFDKINTELISPAADPLTGGDYEFRDPDVEAGRTYFYNLEEVEFTGDTSIHGPIEVKASRNGLLEGILAGLLVIGSFSLFVRKKEAQEGLPDFQEV